MKKIIATKAAPEAIGPYSQAVQFGETTYLSGQIALNPSTMALNNASVETEIRQVFANLTAVCEAAGGTLNDLAKLNIYLTNLDDFALLNEIMAEHFQQPYPARAAVEVSALPKGARVEMEAVMVGATK